MSKYTVAKRDGLWWVLDAEGYEISYVGHETKREAVAACRLLEFEDERAKRNADRVDGYDRDDLGESPDY